MDLSIVIVNYNSTVLILNCLGSIFEQKSAVDFEVIIVDNNSTDGKELIIKSFPDIRWIQMSYNSGFARANNEGIRQSLGGCILLLNNDTIIANNAIEKCYEKFSDSQTSLVGHRPHSTWSGRYPLTQIDHVFINSFLQVNSVFVPRTSLDQLASDHLPLIVDVSLKD